MVIVMTLLVAGSVFGYLQYREGQTFQVSPETDNLSGQQDVNPGPQSGLSEASKAAETTARVRVTIYNGTSTKGLAKEVQDKLKTKFDSMDFVGVGNTKGDFAKTIVIDLSGKNAVTAKELNDELKGQVADKLPEGETRPESDILVILGNDYAR